MSKNKDNDNEPVEDSPVEDNEVFFMSDDMEFEADPFSMTEGVLTTPKSGRSSHSKGNREALLIGYVPLIIRIRFSSTKDDGSVLNYLVVAGELKSLFYQKDTAVGSGQPNLVAHTSISFDLEPSDFFTLASAHKKYLRVTEAVLLLPDGSERQVWSSTEDIDQTADESPSKTKSSKGEIIKIEFSELYEHSCSCVLHFRD